MADIFIKPIALDRFSSIRRGLGINDETIRSIRHCSKKRSVFLCRPNFSNSVQSTGWCKLSNGLPRFLGFKKPSTLIFHIFLSLFFFLFSIDPPQTLYLPLILKSQQDLKYQSLFYFKSLKSPKFFLPQPSFLCL